MDGAATSIKRKILRILFLTHGFNSLTQRLFVELTQRGHQVTIEFDINDQVTIEAVRLAEPDLIIAPFLKRAIPEPVWSRHICLVVHPGIEGDQGPSSLDWAIQAGLPQWGVTVLQANAEMDGGPVWETRNFPLLPHTKSSIYRNQVTDAAVEAILACLAHFPQIPSRPKIAGRIKPLMRQQDRAIDWQIDDTATALRKIRAADGNPGLLDQLFGIAVFLHDAHAALALSGQPGQVIARNRGAVAIATRDGAIWIGHLRKREGEMTLKLPATMILDGHLDNVPEIEGYTDIHYDEDGAVGILHFPFHNGAMSTDQCQRLLSAYEAALMRPTKVIVLMGGPDFWSNGIHLNVIEAAASPADESWRNINAMNDLTRAIITTTSHLTVAAMRGNAGAGGVFLALAADHVWARQEIILNPHYKGMGNLYGSEYWTYLLPRRTGPDVAGKITAARLPIGTAEALQLGLIDRQFGTDAQIGEMAQALALDPALPQQLADKQASRLHDEAQRPLELYRADELEKMTLNFYGFDPSYHVARYNFVRKVPKSWTPLYLARHRRKPDVA
jgi:putative two-component system protein, hydrogenase maturation factor HypX/HoxX